MALDKKIQKLEKLKQEVLAELEKVSAEQLNYQFAENEWSLTQVITHIIQSETGTSKYLYKKISEAENLENAGLKNKMNSLALTAALKSAKKFKAPQVVSNPENNYTLEQLKEAWNTTRIRLIQTIESIPADLHKKAMFKHPVAGPLNISQTLDFLINHIVHHKFQLKKIMSKLS